MIVIQISQWKAIVVLCTCGRPVSIGEALLDESLLKLLQEQLNIALELRGVLYTTGAEVAIDAFLIKLL